MAGMSHEAENELMNEKRLPSLPDVDAASLPLPSSVSVTVTVLSVSFSIPSMIPSSVTVYTMVFALFPFSSGWASARSSNV